MIHLPEDKISEMRHVEILDYNMKALQNNIKYFNYKKLNIEDFKNNYNNDFEKKEDSKFKNKINIYNKLIKEEETEYLKKYKIDNDKILNQIKIFDNLSQDAKSHQERPILPEKRKYKKLAYKANKNCIIKFTVSEKINEKIIYLKNEEETSIAEYVRKKILKYNFNEAINKIKNKKVIFLQDKKVLYFLSNIGKNINTISRYAHTTKRIDNKLILILNEIKIEITLFNSEYKRKCDLETKLKNMQIKNNKLLKEVAELKESK